MTIAFMKQVGYQGILDIGYRLDPRDGLYKVLDVNPRIGGAFRMFVDRDGGDVARALYCDLTGQEVVAAAPREGRKWLIENYDIRSSYSYFKEGSLSIGSWLKSFWGVEEMKWFSWRDPMPFIKVAMGLVKYGCLWIIKRFRPLRKPGITEVQ
jgi:predicted ATP-grasp superfamily ATP-dependent carboligase